MAYLTENGDTMKSRRKLCQPGFTLIELLVVLAIICLLLTLAVPRYFQSIATSKETILLQNLHLTRETIDKYYGDTGRYPESLDELVAKKYLRTLPYDPVAESYTAWVILAPDDAEKGSVYSIKSGAPGADRQGQAFFDL